MSAVRCSLDPLRDVRHRDARLARDQADWLAWLELGGLRSRTLRDYEWATARLLRAYPSKTLDQITPSDIAHVLRSFPPAGRRTKKAAERQALALTLNGHPHAGGRDNQIDNAASRARAKLRKAAA